MNQVSFCHLLDVLVWNIIFLGAFLAPGFLLVVFLTKGTPAAFSAEGFPLAVLTKGNPAAISALGFPLAVLTQGTPTAISATVFLLVVLTNALAGTFFAKVSVVCFPMRTKLPLSLLLFGGRW